MTWGSCELKEYDGYEGELIEYDTKGANNFSNLQSTDASTQTDERRHRRREIAYQPSNLMVDSKTAELTRDEFSPPPPTSSPETLETLVKYSGRVLEDHYMMANNMRGKASAALIHLISCGSIAVKQQSEAVAPQHGARLTRGPHSQIGGSCRFSGGGVVMEKEYFSGSLLEGNGDAEIAAVLKRCSSFTAERGVKMEVPKEIGVHSRCMPRNSKPRKESCNNSSYLPPTSRSTRGSKRFNT